MHKKRPGYLPITPIFFTLRAHRLCAQRPFRTDPTHETGKLTLSNTTETMIPMREY